MPANRTIVFGAILAAFAGVGAAAQSGASRNYRVQNFNSVSAAGPHNVVVSVGGAASVRADGPADVLDKMEVIVANGDLEIRPRREFRNNYRWSDNRRATFYVTAPSIVDAALAGSGDMRVDRVAGDRFAGSVAGSGNLSVGSLRVTRANFSVAGSGDLSASGSANESKLSVAGSGNLNLAGLSTRDASVSVAGSGNVSLTAAAEVDVSVIGSGDVEVAGTARCSVSRIGSGRVRCARR